MFNLIAPETLAFYEVYDEIQGYQTMVQKTVDAIESLEIRAVANGNPTKAADFQAQKNAVMIQRTKANVFFGALLDRLYADNETGARNLG